MNNWTQRPENIYVAAHRGWSAAYPENTLAAFRAAMDAGADQIETDVRVTADGALVLIHDATVDRTTGGTGLVCEMTLDQLRQLDAGDGQRIPTLEEFFELICDHPTLTIDLELKEYPEFVDPAVAFDVCDRVIAMTEAYGFGDRCVINSFSGGLNDYVFRKYGGKYRQHVFYPRERLHGGELDPYSYAYCCCMPKEPDPAEYAYIASRGVQPWAGASVKDAASLDAVLPCKPCLITCNDPALILRLLRERGLHA